jgi:single-strand selective monofunctional uracil DNA glycosylase
MEHAPMRRARAGKIDGDPLGAAIRFSSRRFAPLARSIARATGWLVLDPSRYGERWHAPFRRLYPPRARPLLVFGLNPGPYGMAQTGIPFTDLKRLAQGLPRLAAELARSGERLSLPGLAPSSLQPFLTRTFESSSVRVHRFLRLAHGSAERAFREVVFVNPCPLLFIDRALGENRTPADLPRALRAGVDEARVEVVSVAVARLRARGAIVLGRDAAAALSVPLRARLGERAVVEWEHPARAVPDIWARGLLAALRRRGLLASSRRRP